MSTPTLPYTLTAGLLSVPTLAMRSRSSCSTAVSSTSSLFDLESDLTGSSQPSDLESDIEMDRACNSNLSTGASGKLADHLSAVPPSSIAPPPYISPSLGFLGRVLAQAAPRNLHVDEDLVSHSEHRLSLESDDAGYQSGYEGTDGSKFSGKKKRNFTRRTTETPLLPGAAIRTSVDSKV